MARCFALKDALNSRSAKFIQACGSGRAESCYNSAAESFDFDEYKDNLRKLFDQALSVFSRNTSVQPGPALLGDGQIVDLFKLLWVVRKRGGYDVVSKRSLWGFVAEECGLGFKSMAPVRLIYIKNLKEMDQRLRKASKGESLKNGDNGVVTNLKLLLLELEKEFRSFLSERGEDANKVSVPAKLGSKNASKDANLDNGRSNASLHDNAGRLANDDDEKNCAHDAAVLTKTVAEKACGSQKRKRKSSSFSGMLRWVIQVAKHPDDPALGMLPDCFKWKEHYQSKEFWVQALLARDALLVRKYNNSNAEECHFQAMTSDWKYI